MKIAIPRTPASWRSLPTPTREQIDAALAWLATLPDDREHARWVDGEDAGLEYCYEHADAIVTDLRAMGVEAYIGGPGAECDSSAWCETCGKELDAALTDYGVNSALGITESDPLHVHVTLGELLSSADTMMPDDERWRLWLWHVDLRRVRASLSPAARAARQAYGANRARTFVEAGRMPRRKP